MAEIIELPVADERPQVTGRLRFVTATSLFDGHDASINVIRRLLQAAGVEVVHLGHNRSVQEVVTAAMQEDADGIAISSYQGGHIEYFKYVIDMLQAAGRSNIKVFGGGGGVIVPQEIDELHDYGVARIYSPSDGQNIGLRGMIDDMLSRCVADGGRPEFEFHECCATSDFNALARLITAIEKGAIGESERTELRESATASTPVLGITGTGGSGKSSLTDELVQRFRLRAGARIRIAILAVDPTRKRTGGALLGDRIRMNAVDGESIYVRSLATRDSDGIPGCLVDVIAACKRWEFDLIIVETPGIGQGDTGILPFVDRSVYVMTPEYGAASQLEKIDMLDFADFVAINKFDAKGAEDAYRDVCKQVQRNREQFDVPPQEMPVYGTISSRFNDDGVSALFFAIARLLKIGAAKRDEVSRAETKMSSNRDNAIPAARVGYLAEIAASVRDYHEHVREQSAVAAELQHLAAARRMLGDDGGDGSGRLDELIGERERRLSAEAKKLLDEWPARKQAYRNVESLEKPVKKQPASRMFHETLSGTQVPRIGLPDYSGHGDLLKWLMLENLPGSFPYTAGVFSFKRDDEDPTRMFAGEGGPSKTNKRFKLLSRHARAKRLSTAFDSVSLYGFDPDPRPDIYGKIGNSGVSIATLDDMKDLYAGFDLCSPQTSVSMTINGPAPSYLAMLLNTAIDQRLDAFVEKNGREADGDEAARIRAEALRAVRGTVQADILKEDQGQNTCIFSTEFSLKVMGDIQDYFIANEVHNFYSVSISGYHIAEAGANPISQLAFTLANAFTYVELYLARGMDIDDFAANLSFFFSNGLDAEYTVMGRVARRVWAIALRERYGANARSQRLKYHIQTSGRSLHAQEIDFNDIRTTLQALIAVYDNCNSLHTNAYDEAITTPTEESVRRAMAIQLIINQEWGLSRNENPNQGSFIFEELTDLVEEAVLAEFESISSRGGVLGAMETGYQRGRIQEQSLYYERKKHDGSLPIIGVNTFMNSQSDGRQAIDLARSSETEKQDQLRRLSEFHDANAKHAQDSLERLKQTVMDDRNVFEELMSTVRHCSVGQITAALFEVGGKYRRNM